MKTTLCGGARCRTLKIVGTRLIGSCMATPILRSFATTVGSSSATPHETSPTWVMHKLLQIPRKDRDASWQSTFLISVPQSIFEINTSHVIHGPDGFSYMDFKLIEPKEYATLPENTSSIAHLKEVSFLLKHGLGLSIRNHNSQVETDNPEWVFSYGDLVQFALTGSFEPKKAPELPQGQAYIKAGEEMSVGQPSEAYLPAVAGGFIRDFVKQNSNIKEPKVLLIERTVNGQLVKELAFMRDRYEVDLLQRITWYLPRHYSIIAMPDPEGTLKGHELPSYPL